MSRKISFKTLKFDDSEIVSEQCERDFAKYEAALHNFELWALKSKNEKLKFLFLPLKNISWNTQ